MGKTAVTAQQAIDALKGTAGIKTHIARKLGVSRPTVDAYLKRWSTFREAYEQEKAGVDDMAVSVVVEDIVTRKNVETAKWWIARKLDEFKDKGPAGSQDDPVHIAVVNVKADEL